MRVSIRATEEAIIRLLRAGHPLAPDVVNRPEETRLPVFQSVEAVPVKNYGIEGNGRIVLARGRKDVWFVDIKRRSTSITDEDGQKFLAMRDQIKSRYPGQKVTGWLITTAKVETTVRDAIAAAECLSTAGAAER
jgi:hypothetical protein